MNELEREIRGLEGDKRMTEMAVSTMKNMMSSSLKGEMGDDIDKVLNGERFVEVTVKEKFRFKLLSLLRKIFRMF